MTRKSEKYDAAVIGGGIVGLASAYALLERFPGLGLVLFEKEPRLASHQTGRNSGVIHSGIYYRPGSLKAKLCRTGAERLKEFCDSHRIPCQRVGKVIVAASDRELPGLESLFERGKANLIPGLSRIGPERLKALEPNVRGIAALHLPETAIVDFAQAADALAAEIRKKGGVILTSSRFLQARETNGCWRLETNAGTFQAGFLINCGGLQADRIAQGSGEHPDAAIIPFRGEFYRLRPEKSALVRGLVYPVPDPAFPFLGVHFTKTLANDVLVGPNAVLALKREGYLKKDFSLVDCLELITYPGFWNMSRRFWKIGVKEWIRAGNKKVFATAAKKLVPSLAEADLLESPSGVRAQAVARDGSLVDDFLLQKSRRALHVLNAPSPAATSSLAIGEAIADQLEEALAGRR